MLVQETLPPNPSGDKVVSLKNASLTFAGANGRVDILKISSWIYRLGNR